MCCSRQAACCQLTNSSTDGQRRRQQQAAAPVSLGARQSTAVLWNKAVVRGMGQPAECRDGKRLVWEDAWEPEAAPARSQAQPMRSFHTRGIDPNSRAGLNSLQKFPGQLVNLLCLLSALKALPELLAVRHVPVSEARSAAVVVQSVADAVCISEAAAKRCAVILRNAASDIGAEALAHLTGTDAAHLSVSQVW